MVSPLSMGGAVPSLSSIANNPLGGVNLGFVTQGLNGKTGLTNGTAAPATGLNPLAGIGALTGAPTAAAPAALTAGAPAAGTMDPMALLQNLLSMLGMGGAPAQAAVVPAMAAPAAGAGAAKMGAAEGEDGEGKKAKKKKGKGRKKDKDDLPPGIAKKRAEDLPDGNPFKAALADRDKQAQQKQQGGQTGGRTGGSGR